MKVYFKQTFHPEIILSQKISLEQKLYGTAGQRRMRKAEYCG